MKNNNHLLDNVEEFELSPINDSEIESKKKINLSKSAKAAIIFEAIILVVLIIIFIVIFFQKEMVNNNYQTIKRLKKYLIR